MRALYAAATGMAAQELNVQVISNNIANLRTTGYKRQQVHFQDLLYQNMRRAGASTSQQNTQLPAGLSLGFRRALSHNIGLDLELCARWSDDELMSARHARPEHIQRTKLIIYC